MKIKMLLTFYSLFFSLFLSAQFVENLSLESHIISTEDTLKLRSLVKTPAGGCGLVNQEVNVIDNKIEVINCYWYGFLDTVCPTYDTLLLTGLASGFYELSFYIKANSISPIQVCLGEAYPYEKQLKICVEDPLNEIDPHRFRLLQNPARDILSIKSFVAVEGSYRLKVFDLLGKLVALQKYEIAVGGSELELMIEHLNSGLYICVMEQSGKWVWSDKFFKG